MDRLTKKTDFLRQMSSHEIKHKFNIVNNEEKEEKSKSKLKAFVIVLLITSVIS